MDHPDSPNHLEPRDHPDHPDRRTLPFPSPRSPPRPASLNPRRRLYLCTPTQDELIHRSLDLAAQVGIATTRVDREIATDITHDRLRRLFPTAPSPTQN